MARRRQSEILKMNPVRDSNLKLEINGGTLEQLQAAVARANREATIKLGKMALTNLNRSVESHGRPQTFKRERIGKDKKTRPLTETLLDPDMSESDANDFTFFMDKKVRKRSPHYWVQERGTDRFVGKLAPIQFRQGTTIRRPSASRYPKDATLRTATPTKRDDDGNYVSRGGGVYIKNEIKGYHYLERAVDEFRKDNNKIYRDILVAEMKRLRKGKTGMVITIGSTKV